MLTTGLLTGIREPDKVTGSDCVAVLSLWWLIVMMGSVEKTLDSCRTEAISNLLHLVFQPSSSSSV